MKWIDLQQVRSSGGQPRKAAISFSVVSYEEMIAEIEFRVIRKPSYCVVSKTKTLQMVSYVPRGDSTSWSRYLGNAHCVIIL